MAVDLHTTTSDSSSSSHQDLYYHSNLNGSDLKPPVMIPCDFGSLTSSAETHANKLQNHDLLMPHFMTPYQDLKFHFSGIRFQNFESAWDSINLSQSMLSSTLASTKGSSEESLCPLDPAKSYDVVEMLEKMKLDERGRSKYNNGYSIQNYSNTSNVGISSHQSFFQQQIRAIQLSRLRQDQILSQKQNHSQILEQFHKKDSKRVNVERFGNGQRNRPSRQRQTGSEMRAVFLDSSSSCGSRGASCGTGVFFPRGGTVTPSESRKRPDKGCTTVLIPARVVQALQLHFDQMAATSGPNATGFPPPHDVLVSNRNGMYSLQRRQSQEKHIENDMTLPREWTY